MQSHQTSLRTSGALFIIPLLAYGIGNSLLHSASAGIDDTRLMAGALLMLLNSLTVIALASVLYPVLSHYHQATGSWYLCIRIVEAVLLVVGMIFLLMNASIPVDTSLHPVIGQPTRQPVYLLAHNWLYQLAMIVLGFGSIPFCYLLYRQRLASPVLSLWGMGGYALLALGACLELFGYRVGVFLSLPGGLFELVLGIRLLWKGAGAQR